MLGTGATAWTIISTVALLNLRNVLYGMSARRWLPRDSPPRPILAHCLVDESYGLAEREAAVGRPSGWFLGGAGLSLYLAWNLSVATGLILSRYVEIPTDIGLDFRLSLIVRRPDSATCWVNSAIGLPPGPLRSRQSLPANSSVPV